MNTNRRSRGPILFLLLCLSAMPLFAQAPPSFLIEKIDVRNVKRASPQVVRSESLLREGQAYTEQQLQDAQSRIRRLPFVLDVEFSLEKGSQRDVYVLVMDVDEASPFFVGVDHNVYPSYEGRPSVDGTLIDGGVRWFVGDYGQVHATVGGDLDEGARSLAFGYTHYNLLRRSIFFSATVSTGLGNGYEGFAGSSVLGIPIRGNHSVRLNLDTLHSDENEHSFGTSSGRLGASWVYDTTNDALFPTAGSTVVAGLNRGRSESRGVIYVGPEPGIPGPITTRRTTSDDKALQLVARKYFPVRELDAILLEGRLGSSRISPDLGPDRESSGFAAQAGYSGSLWGLEKTRKHGDLRYELALRGDRSKSSYDAAGSPEFTGESVGLVAGIAHRNRWALLRLSVFWTLSSDYTPRGVINP